MSTAIAPKERPVPFKDWEVRATLDGRKTQFRRVLGKQLQGDYDGGSVHADGNGDLYLIEAFCPYGQPGDRLWVQETFSLMWPEGCEDGFVSCGYDDPRHFCEGERPVENEDCRPVYKADVNDDYDRPWKEDGPVPWKPSPHMPRWASRILLEVTDVRVERVQDISLGDCWDEGVRAEEHNGGDGDPCDEMRRLDGFAQLWDSINAKRGFGWDANPWVWVVEFKVLEVKT